MRTSRYYVYVLARPDGEPFYVGKGQKNRIYRHEDEARRGHTCDKCDVIREIWQAGGEIQRSVVLTTNDEQEAFAYETELILLYGRLTLVNQTDGGLGQRGRTFSQETRERQSAGLRRRYASDPMYRQKILDHLAAWRASQSPEAMSRKARESGNKPEEVTRRREQAKYQWATTDLRATVSERAKARWADPEFRARMSAKAKAQMGTPEARERISRQMKGYYAERQPEQD